MSEAERVRRQEEAEKEKEQVGSENSFNTASRNGTNEVSIELGQQSSGPPPLPYNLRDHKLSIFLNWLLIVLDSACLPVILYFALPSTAPHMPNHVEHGGLRPGIIFAIITSVAGILSPIKYFFGILRLIKKDSTYIPIGSKRWRLDYFHVTFSVAYGVYIIELIIGSAPHDPWVRLLALPAPSTVFCMGIMILIPQWRYMRRKPHLYRVSSYDKGHPARPGVYPFIEDVVAVEGFGGRPWREALHARYDASPYFQRMLSKLTMFWLFGCFVMPAICAAVVATTIEPVAYAFGWIFPFAWGGLWALITTLWTQRMLRKEKRLWAGAS